MCLYVAINGPDLMAYLTELTIHLKAGESPFSVAKPINIVIDRQPLNDPVLRQQTDRSFQMAFHKENGKWYSGELPKDQVRKTHNLQGPIDDALMDSFIFVKPTGKSSHPKVQAWADAELTRAIEHWRRHFRGHARVKNDTELTKEDLANSHLILWGDAQCNRVIKQIAEKLPLLWTADAITVGEKKYSAQDHALISISPNPLNPKRYVVLNSSFTFRDFAYLNNARQVPMLPDWAVIDLKTPPGNVWPGKVVSAGFFDESWQWKPKQNSPNN